jgi:soluble lytic murein transglycosylase-like protein
MILKLAVLVAFAVPSFAGEYAVLWTGFRLHADRHETEGVNIRLYANGGMTEIPAAQISRFEADEQVPTIQPTAAIPPSPEELVADAARRHGLPPDFVKSVVWVESAYRADAVSRKGAIGLMQLMPSTAREYGADPNDPRQNVEAGTRYLRDLLLKYQHDDHQVMRALAAYNAGPGAVDRYNGVPPYHETLAYVGRVLRKYEKQRPKPSAAERTPDRPSPPE